MKTFSNMDPANSALDRSVVDEFLRQQEEMLEVLEMARKSDLGKIRIPITLARWIRFKLGDAFRFCIYHHVRHMDQVDGILQAMKSEKQLVK